MPLGTALVTSRQLVFGDDQEASDPTTHGCPGTHSKKTKRLKRNRGVSAPLHPKGDAKAALSTSKALTAT